MPIMLRKIFSELLNEITEIDIDQDKKSKLNEKVKAASIKSEIVIRKILNKNCRSGNGGKIYGCISFFFAFFTLIFSFILFIFVLKYYPNHLDKAISLISTALTFTGGIFAVVWGAVGLSRHRKQKGEEDIKTKGGV